MPAAEGSIRIRIGAVADRSLETVFGGIEKRALRLRDTLGKSLTLGGSRGGASPLERSFGGIERAAKRSADGVDRVWSQELSRLDKIAKAQDKLYERTERNKVREAERGARERARIEERANRAIEKTQRDFARQADRSAAQQERTRRQFAERTSWRTTRFVFPPPTGALDVGRRVASDILRGTGVDFSIQGSVARGVSLQTAAMQLANAERIATGSTRGAAAYEGIARSAGIAQSADPGNVMRLASRFAAKSGNYADLDKVVPALVSMATASGTEDFGQVGEAAAAAYNQTKGAKDPIGTMLAVMRGTIGQAAEGAIDPADYAKYLSPIASGAFKFQGDRGENILKLSALAQLSMERGARSPAQAAQAIGSFSSTFGKQARIKAFRKNNVDLFTDDKHDTFRDPFEIIKDSFRKTNGDIPKLSSMYMDVLGRKPIESLGAVYKQAGGGEAGIKAIQAEFDRYMGKQLTKDTEQKNNVDYQNSDAGKAAKFQARWDAVFAKMTREVLPALEQLADPTIQLANIFASTVKFAVDMPAIFGGLLLGGVLLRAAMESAARSYLEQKIMKSAMPGLPGAPADGGGTGIGAFFTGGGGYTGARGVLNSQAAATLAPIAAIAGVSAAVDQASAFANENGGWEGFKGMLGIGVQGWGAEGISEVQDRQAREAARIRAEQEAKVATVSGGPAAEAAKPMSQDQMSQAVSDAIARGIKINNWPPGIGSAPPPTVSPDGRTK